MAMAACGGEEQPAAGQPQGEPEVEVVPAGQAAVQCWRGTSAGTDAGGAAASRPQHPPRPEPAGRIEVWHSWAESDADALAEILAASSANTRT